MKDQSLSPCGYGLSCEIVEGLCAGLYTLGKTNIDLIPNALEALFYKRDDIRYPVYLFEMPPTCYGTCIAQVELRKDCGTPIMCTRYYVDTYKDSAMQRKHRLEQMANAVIATVLGEIIPNFIDDISPDETYSSINSDHHIQSLTEKMYEALDKTAV